MGKLDNRRSWESGKNWDICSEAEAARTGVCVDRPETIVAIKKPPEKKVTIRAWYMLKQQEVITAHL